MVKELVNRQTTLPNAVDRIKSWLQQMGSEYDAEINEERTRSLRLLDKYAFRVLAPKLTSYSLMMLSKEWEATKLLGDAIEKGENDEVYIDVDNENPQCPEECELPLRFGLPCRYWMYTAFIHDSPLPLSLINPRWLLDGPEKVLDWTMSGELPTKAEIMEMQTVATAKEISKHLDRHASDKFRNHGQNLMMTTAIAAIEEQGKLNGPQAEAFAQAFQKATDHITATATERGEHLEQIPLELPATLKTTKVKEFPNSHR